MSSTKNYSVHAPKQNLKRKRSFDETEEYTESSMQPARRRCKKADYSRTWNDRTITFDIGESCDRKESGVPRTTAKNTTSFTRKKNVDKPLVRGLTCKEINCSSAASHESSSDAEKGAQTFGDTGRPNSSAREESKASAAAKPVRSTSRRSSEGTAGTKPMKFGLFSVIKKILNENRKSFELSAPNRCSSNEKKDNGEYSNRESTSRRRISAPCKSIRMSGNIVRENEDSDEYKETDSTRKGNRVSDFCTLLKPLEAYSLGAEVESSEGYLNSRTSSPKVKSPIERFESSSVVKGNRKVSIIESPNERSSGIATVSSSKKSSISSVITNGHDEKKSSQISSSMCHSLSNGRDYANYSSQHSISRNSNPQSQYKQPHVLRKGEEKVFDESNGLHSSGKRSIPSDCNTSSKLEEIDFLNLKEESFDAPYISSRMPFVRVDSSSSSSGSSDGSISSDWEGSLPNMEESGWKGSCTMKSPDEYSSSCDVEKRRNIKNSHDKMLSHSKKRYSDKPSKKVINYKNRYFSPSSSKGSFSTPRRDRYSPSKYKLPSSTPRMGNKDSYHQATPWVADFLSSKESRLDTPRARPKISSTKFSRGPFLNSYQLLGDSLLVRFADQILNNRAVIGENGKYCIGLCVSGQTIDGLIEKLLKSSQPLEHKVIVLIGTNDFLKGSSFMQVKSCMLRLLNILKERVSEMLLLTVPPIPRLKSPTFWEDWEKYNGWIKALDNGTTISVLDTARIYLKKTREPDLSSYERFMGYGTKRRPDLIHLNRDGLKLLHQEILNHTNKLKGC